MADIVKAKLTPVETTLIGTIIVKLFAICLVIQIKKTS